jgi:hypothetical protein
MSVRLQISWRYRVLGVGEVTLLGPAEQGELPEGGDLDLPYWRVENEDGAKLIVQESDLQVLGREDDIVTRPGPTTCRECKGTGRSSRPDEGRCHHCGGDGIVYPTGQR